MLTKFFYRGEPLESVNSFDYLGITLTTRLSSSKHVDKIVAKCNSRVSLLFSRLPFREAPFPVALDVFNIFILPIICYGLPLWLPKISKEAGKKLNALFTKFMKRWLGIPYCSNNAAVYSICKTPSLVEILNCRAPKMFHSLSFPSSFSGTKLTPPSRVLEELCVAPALPGHFSSLPCLQDLPVNSFSRRALLYDKLDLFHSHLCVNPEFHVETDDSCVCKLCHCPISHFHHQECVALSSLTPCSFYKEIMGA